VEADRAAWHGSHAAGVRAHSDGDPTTVLSFSKIRALAQGSTPSPRAQFSRGESSSEGHCCEAASRACGNRTPSSRGSGSRAGDAEFGTPRTQEGVFESTASPCPGDWHPLGRGLGKGSWTSLLRHAALTAFVIATPLGCMPAGDGGGSGGAAAGGVGSGGVSSGGGVGTGGVGTGGLGSGGLSTGGDMSGSGGLSTGGSTGGVASGGASSGGAASGGA